MTDDRMALIELIEKGADGDLVRDMLAFAAERIMEIGGRGARPAPATAADHSGSNQSPQRLSRAAVGDAGRPDRPRDPEAAQGHPICRASWSRAAPPRRPWPR
jgi:putative transposase